MRQQNLVDLIKEIAEQNTSAAINLSIRDIQELIKQKTGETPNAVLIASALRTNGLDTQGKGRRWVWKHRGDHE